MFLELALKNVLRNKKRTAITLVAVFMGIFFTVLADGLNQGLEWQIGNTYIKTDSGAAKVVASGYKIGPLENPLDYPIRNEQPIVARLGQASEVKAVSPRISFGGTLSNGQDEIRAFGIGVDPVKEDAVFDRSKSIISGRFLKPGDTGIVLGSDLARLLQVKVGDTVTIIAKATEMGYNAYDLEIKGLIRTANPAVDAGTFFVPIGFAKDFLSFKGVTEIAVAVKDNNRIVQFAKDFNTNGFSQKIKVLTWRDFAADFIQLIAFRRRMMSIITGIILLMAAAGIMNTMLMAILERKKEIGVMMAMGVRRPEVLRLFLAEGSLIGLLGSATAVILGGILIYYYQLQGIPFAGSDQLGNFPIAGRFYPFLVPGHLIAYLILGVGVAVLSTLYPAWKSTCLKPVEAIQGRRG